MMLTEVSGIAMTWVVRAAITPLSSCNIGILDCLTPRAVYSAKAQEGHERESGFHPLRDHTDAQILLGMSHEGNCPLRYTAKIGMRYLAEHKSARCLLRFDEALRLLLVPGILGENSLAAGGVLLRTHIDADTSHAPSAKEVYERHLRRPRADRRRREREAEPSQAERESVVRGRST